MSSQEEISESLAFVNNVSQWPKYDGYRSLSRDPGKAEIRLIDLSYDVHTTRIDCTFKHADINVPHHDSYFALSYCWGAPGIVRSIYIDGAKVEIRKTVCDFLKALGRRFGRLTIWLDVLCINQQDVNERSQQVSMMLEIFSKASSVYVWLGKGGADANVLFEGIRTFQAHGSKAVEATSHSSVPKMFAYARQLLQHSYFTRVWIIQEFIVAQNLHIFCGANMMEWHLFCSTIERFESFTASSTTTLAPGEYRKVPELIYARKLSDFRKNYSQGKTFKLADLQKEFSGSACEDPRDLLYGLRGLAVERNEIAVDYSQSIIHALLQALATNNQISKTSYLDVWGNWVFETMKPFSVTSEDVLKGLRNSSMDRLFFDVVISQQPKIQKIIVEIIDNQHASKKTVVEDPFLSQGALIICSSKSLQPQDILVMLGKPADSWKQAWNLALILRCSENSGHSVVDIVFWSSESLQVALGWARMQDSVRQEQDETTMLKLLLYRRTPIEPYDAGRLPQIDWSLDSTLKSHRNQLRTIYLQDGFQICQKSTSPKSKIHVGRATVFAATCGYLLDRVNLRGDRKFAPTDKEAESRRERWKALLFSIEHQVRHTVADQQLCYC